MIGSKFLRINLQLVIEDLLHNGDIDICHDSVQRRVDRPRSAEHEDRQAQTQFNSGYLEALALISSEGLPASRTRS